MGGIKRTVFFALLLAFVAGIGAGAWVSDLRAAPDAPANSIERRVEAWRDRYDLTTSQVRRLRDVLLRYDAGSKRVLTELDTERWRRIKRLESDARKDIDRILGKEDASAPEKGG